MKEIFLKDGYYRQIGNNIGPVHMMVKEGKTLYVCSMSHTEWSPPIDVVTISSESRIPIREENRYEEITPEEFKEVYAKALNIINI